jgi:hypothetical protein
MPTSISTDLFQTNHGRATHGRGRWGFEVKTTTGTRKAWATGTLQQARRQVVASVRRDDPDCRVLDVTVL